MGAANGKEKECNRCRKTRPLSAFYQNKMSRDGRTAQCADCLRGTAAKKRREENERMKSRVLRPPQRQVQLPISNGRWAVLQGPFPVSGEEFDEMMHLLRVMKPGLIEPR